MTKKKRNPRRRRPTHKRQLFLPFFNPSIFPSSANIFFFLPIPYSTYASCVVVVVVVVRWTRVHSHRPRVNYSQQSLMSSLVGGMRIYFRLRSWEGLRIFLSGCRLLSAYINCGSPRLPLSPHGNKTPEWFPPPLPPSSFSSLSHSTARHSSFIASHYRPLAGR